MGAVTSTEHDYRRCHDEFCERFPCRVYREGFEAGHAAGGAAGFSEGYAAGYAEAAADGGE